MKWFYCSLSIILISVLGSVVVVAQNDSCDLNKYFELTSVQFIDKNWGIDSQLNRPVVAINLNTTLLVRNAHFFANNITDQSLNFRIQVPEGYDMSNPFYLNKLANINYRFPDKFKDAYNKPFIIYSLE